MLKRSVALVLLLCAGSTACGSQGPSSTSASTTAPASPGNESAEGSTSTAKGAKATPGDDTDMLPAGPSGRTLKDLGRADAFGKAGLNIGLAQAGGSIVVSSANPNLTPSDPTAMATTDFWSVDLATADGASLGSATGLAYGLASTGDQIVAALGQCTGRASTERGCFASMSPPKFAVTPAKGTGPAGVFGLITSGHDAYVLSAAGPAESMTQAVTKAWMVGPLDVASWPTVTVPERPGSSSDRKIVGIATLTDTTSVVMTVDGIRSTIDWKSGKITEAGTVEKGEDSATLCGAGGNSFVVSFVEGDDWTEADMQVRPADGDDAWKQIVKPEGGTNLGAEPLDCAATKTGIWIVESGELFELDASDGHLVKRYDLRPDGDEDGGGVQPHVSISDDAIVVYTNDHLYTLL